MTRPPAVDDATLLAFEAHETYAHTVGDRLVCDLGDCLLLHAPSEPIPYVNRLGAVRWPEDPHAFDRRLTEALALFAEIDRRPHLWTAPAFRRPVDIEARLRANGFVDAGAGAYLMALAGEPVAAPVPPGASLERVPADDPRVGQRAWIGEVALVLARAFGFPDEDRAALELDVERSSSAPGMTTVAVREGGEILATGRAYVANGLAYLLSVGTDPLAAGRGLGRFVTTTLARDAIAAGARHVFLAVRTENDRAADLYRRCGFETVGERAGELILG